MTTAVLQAATRRARAIAAGVAVALGAAVGFAAPAPRLWQSVSFADVDVSPFYWASGSATCSAKRDLYLPERFACEVSLQTWPAGTPRPTSAYLATLRLSWRESLPQRDCRQKLARFCEAPRSGGLSSWAQGYAASVGMSQTMYPVTLFTSSGPISPTEQDFEAVTANFERYFPSPARDRLFRNLLDRIEPYAVPCTCEDSPVQREDPWADRGGEPTSRPGDPGFTLDDVPPIDVDSDLLGQDRESGVGPRPAGGGRALRGATGGFPDDVVVTSLRFFPGSSSAVASYENRAYDERFDESVEYISVELNLTYPERRERFSFEMDLEFLKDGESFARFSQPTVPLEPGWTWSRHATGWGQKGGGYWQPGSYQVLVRVGGSVVASGSFEIDRSGR